MLYSKAGLIYAIPIELFGMFMAIQSNSFIVKCMNFMPKQLTRADTKLTYGMVVNYILDKRPDRLTGNESPNPRFYQNMLDIQVFLSSVAISVCYLRYVFDALSHILA